MTEEVKTKGLTFIDTRRLANISYKDIKNGFVGFGYYLKIIRDEKLWQGNGYNSFNQFLDTEYGRDKSWASRCINLYDKFGIPVEPGELPRLEEQYEAYNVSQLIEMIPMQEELREQVTPDMAVKAIRALKPRKEKVAMVATPEPEPREPDGSPACPPDTTSCERQEWGTSQEEQAAGHKECEKCWASWKRRQNKPDVAEVKQEPLEEVKLPDPDEDWGIGELPQAKELYLKQLARVLVQECGNELRMTPGEIGRPSDDTIRKQTDMLRLAHNGIVGLDDGVDAFPSEDMIEFFRDGVDLGVCSHARFVTQVRKALEEADAERRKPETDKSADDISEPGGDGPESVEPVSKPAETVSKVVKTVSDTQENVIDGEFTEVQEPEEYTPRYFLEEQKAKLDRLLAAANGVELKPMDTKVLERQKTIVCALETTVCEMAEPDPPAQPELPVLKNNDQRAAFVDAYETWPLWIETKQTGERYYRYDLEDGTSMVVKVYHARIFDGYASGSYEAQYHDGYGRNEYYLLNPGKFFRDCETNRSLLIEKLKEIQKVKKG